MIQESYLLKQTIAFLSMTEGKIIGKYKWPILETKSLNSSFSKIAKRDNNFQINTLPQMDYGRRIVNTWGKIGDVVEDKESGVSQIINVTSGN